MAGNSIVRSYAAKQILHLSTLYRHMQIRPRDAHVRIASRVPDFRQLRDSHFGRLVKGSMKQRLGAVTSLICRVTRSESLPKQNDAKRVQRLRRFCHVAPKVSAAEDWQAGWLAAAPHHAFCVVAGRS
jgi:hypothetical protein